MNTDAFLKDILRFREERDWKQFHNPKDLAISLVLEAGEVLEHMQWKNGEELEKRMAERKEKVGEELVDVLYWTLLLAHDLGIDLEEAVAKKMEQNQEKYPAHLSKGKSTKYTELQEV